MRKAIIAVPIIVLVLLAMLIVFFPERWLANRIEVYALENTGYELSIGELKLDLLRWQPSVTMTGVDIDGTELPGLVKGASFFGSIDLRSLLSGELLIDRLELSQANVLALREQSDINTWIPAPVAAESKDDDASNNDPFVLPNVRSVLIEDVTIRLSDAVTGYEGALNVEGEGTTLPGSLSVSVNVGGDLQGEPVQVQLSASPIGESPSIESGASIKLDSALGMTNAVVEGTIGNLMSMRDIELDVSMVAEDLVAIEKLLQLKLPTVAPMRFNSSMLREENDWVLRRFDLDAVNSTIEGDVRFDPSTTPVTVFANLISPQLDVDTLIEVLLGPVTTDENAPTIQPEDESANVGTTIFPDEPLPLVLLTGQIQGAIDLDVTNVVTDRIPLNAINARAEFSDDTATLSIAQIDIGGGSMSGNIELKQLSVAEQPDSLNSESTDSQQVVPVSMNIELELARLQLGRFLRKADLPDDAGGLLGGRIKYWAEGASVASLAGSLDGGAFLLMTGGTIDSLLLELAGIDVFQSLGDAIVPGKENVEILCAYIDMHSEDGAMNLKEFVIDTTDTVMLARGGVNLKNEVLDLIVEPHPKDASLISASTAVRIDGSFASPDVSVDGSLLARAAAVAILSQVAAPALALLPLLEPRSGNDSPFCSGLEGVLDDATK